MHLRRIQNSPRSPDFHIKKNTAPRSQNKIIAMTRLYPKTERYTIETENTIQKKKLFQPKLFQKQSSKEQSKCPSFILQLQKKKSKECTPNNLTMVSNKQSPVSVFPNSSKNFKTKDIFQLKATSLQKQGYYKPPKNCSNKKKYIDQKNENLQSSEIMEVLTIESSQQDQYRKNDQFFMDNKMNPKMFVKQCSKSASQKQIRIKKKKSVLCIENFKIIKRIGKGSYGEVFLVQQINTNALFALKKICKTKLQTVNEKEQAIRQIKIQSYLQSESIAPLYGWFSDESYLYLIMEYFETGTLSDLLNKKGKFTQLQTINYIKQISKAIKTIHNQKIIHRDLKVQNIFLHNITAKIGDFGCSIYTSQLRQSIVGCYVCLSPQQLQTQKYDEKVDIWSLGIICYQMLMGFSPFQDQLLDIISKKKNPNQLQLKFPDSCKLSTYAKNFIKKCLSLNPADRPSAVELLSDIFLNMPKEKTILSLKVQ